MKLGKIPYSNLSFLLLETKLILLFFLFMPFAGIGQIEVEGVVKDSTTKQGIPFVKIRFTEQGTFALTDTAGYFKLKSKQDIDTLLVAFIGYQSQKIPLTEGAGHDIEISLSEHITNLTTIVIEPGENPAFEILRQVKDRKKENDPERLDAFSCEVYNKMQFDIKNMSEDFAERRVFKKYDFIMDYMDTVNGSRYLPLLLTESISDYYFKSSPKQKKEIIKASRITGVDNLQLGQFTGDMYQNVNIYDNYVELFNKKFLSPIADEGKLFYKYYLLEEDTLEGLPCYHLQFVPKRKGGALFAGEFWIADSSYAMKRIRAEIPNDVNLNYVTDFGVVQEYSMVEGGHFMLTHEIMVATFDVFNEKKKNRILGATVHKDVSRKKFILNEAKGFDFYVKDVVILDSAEERSEAYWDSERHSDLSKEEAGVIEMVDSLKKNPTFKFHENLIYLAYTGFYRVGPIEFGHIYSMYNRNVVEQHRFMLSLRTSNKFSKKVEISTFLGYGILDQEWKYGGSLRWKLQESPREMLRFGYKKRIDQLGLVATVGDVGTSGSTLLSTAPLDKLTMVYQAIAGLEKDWNFDMRTFHTLEWNKFIPLGSSDYSRIDQESGDTNQVANLTSFQIRNQVMFTKEEKFLKGQFDRISLGSKYPIVSLTHTWGIKDFLLSEYDFNRLDLIWNHRPRIGMLGRINYTIHAGKIFGQVPYPFLQIHQGNESYYLRINNFNLMNYYEFISDQWVHVLFEHHFQGFIMDRVPLIRKLKLRMVYSGKMVIGSYSDKHNKELLLPFYSRELSSPYYEVGVGLENILKCLRVDFLWRLSYQDNLDLNGDPISNFGIKFMFVSDF